jgi:hypothetical protein
MLVDVESMGVVARHWQVIAEVLDFHQAEVRQNDCRHVLSPPPHKALGGVVFGELQLLLLHQLVDLVLDVVLALEDLLDD